jgi:GT2 family glycosyltransferase
VRCPVPVVFLVYNRIATTRRVFERIAGARPETLLVVADGPRAGRPLDAERCAEVRRLVSRPAWECDLMLDFAPENLGFGRRISSGLERAFAEFETAIVLEDDCLPDPTFFRFCAELLDRYRDDERVMMISGDNFQFGRRRGDASYYFSRAVGTWGWATWRRAFRHFDLEMRAWRELRASPLLDEIWPWPEAARFWRDRLDEADRGEVDAWDFQWACAIWARRGLQVSPNSNLVSYLGCLADSAHTNDESAPYCALPTAPVEFPLVHPAAIERDLAADLYEFRRIFLHLPDAAAAAGIDG